MLICDSVPYFADIVKGDVLDLELFACNWSVDSYNRSMAEKVQTKDRARDWYIGNPLATLRDVATEFEVPYGTVRDWSRDEGWHSLRILKGEVDDEQITLQAAGMRDVLYEEVVSGSLSASEKTGVVKAWLSLLQVRKPPETEDTVDRNAILGDL